MPNTTNKLGHKIGARGGRTRQAILDATRRLLNARHYGEIRVADLASEAGVSPSNFYTYFKTVEEPVLALCEVAATDFQGLATYFQADWPGDKAFTIARAFILDVMAIWRKRSPPTDSRIASSTSSGTGESTVSTERARPDASG